ncbi:hypothetical protein ACIRRA_41940 [Nocardia sp. NPDC101769]|uniref:hypothetical protein n=1 Tax=Nocardia sp. NPDC101769 TaxID=3364333 RepID=UPI00382510D3
MTNPSQWLPAQIPSTAPPAPAPMPFAPAPLVSIGDITVLQGVIITPSGQMPLKGAGWTAVDNSRTETKMPAYAIVLAILLFPVCFAGLLFLLIKETKFSGYIEVSVANAGRYHQTLIPVLRPETFAEVMSRVSYARSVSM